MEQSSIPQANPTIRRDPGYALRLSKACDAVHECPAGHGRVAWVAHQLNNRMGKNFSVQTASRWFSGEVKPRKETNDVIAKMLGVDATWLYLGVDTNSAAKPRAARPVKIAAPVHIVAGLIEMEGGSVAIPSTDDRRAERDNIDLVAVLDGISFSMHIVTGEASGRDYTFSVPLAFDNATVIGLLREGFSFRIVELSPLTIRSNSARDGQKLVVTLPASVVSSLEIRSFNDL